MSEEEIERNRQEYLMAQQRIERLLWLTAFCVAVFSCFYLAVVA